MKLTENFTLEEFTRSATATARKIDNRPTNENVVKNLQRLANYLQKVRNCYARPIGISSGYRCKELNAAVGGAKTSQHVSGEAADIDAGSRIENRRIFEVIRKIGGFDQLIDENDFAWVHVSYRAGRLRGEVLRKVGKSYIRI